MRNFRFDLSHLCNFIRTFAGCMGQKILPITYKRIASAEDFNSLRDLYENYWLIVFSVHKSVMLKIGFDDFSLQKNSVAFLSKDLFCEFVSIESASEIFVIAIDEDFFYKSNYGLPSEFYNIVNKQPVVALYDSEVSVYKNFVADYGNIVKRDFVYKHKMLGNILSNLTLVSLEFWQKRSEHTQITTNNNELTQLCRNFYNLVAKECKHHHGVEYYAEKLGVSRNYLTQTVKQITKQTPKEAIQRQLVNETKNLLLNTDLTVKEISFQLGFNDSSYLCRFFKTQTGESLTVFRKKHLLL